MDALVALELRIFAALQGRDSDPQGFRKDNGNGRDKQHDELTGCMVSPNSKPVLDEAPKGVRVQKHTTVSHAMRTLGPSGNAIDLRSTSRKRRRRNHCYDTQPAQDSQQDRRKAMRLGRAF